MNKLSYVFYRTLLWLWDIFSLNVILLIASFVVGRAEAFEKKEYHVFFAVINLAWMAAVYLTTLYMSKNWLDFESFYKRTAKAYLLTVLILMVFIFLYHYQYSRAYILVVIAGLGLVLSVNRVVFNLLIISLRNKFSLQKNVVVLGYNEISKRLIRYFREESKFVHVAGCFEDKERISELSEFPIMGDLKDCMPFVRENQVTEIYSTLAPENFPDLYELAKAAEKQFVHFKFVPDYKIFVNRNIFVDFVDNIPVLSLRNEPLEDTGNRLKKRLFDIVFSTFVIIFLLSWLIPLIALLIKLDSKGPIFFTQMRSGKNNQPFRCIKFRSLKVNDEANSKQVTRNDSRITRLGRIMRKTNIDELPQFFNVFLGDMSVVGPRPHMLKHTEDFSHLYKQYMIRHFVKPGLTGWAQVNGFRGEITDNKLLQKRIEFDIWYMENWTLWLDLRIIMMTAFLSIKGDKNAF
ncbi:undecaprenyl-phosphate glucose phosphotransferase [Flavihumibacter petaseus]|uniref:Putative UDP-glucose--undecaprenyl-phosphate glucose-1-phosphate transferase n=1 Tax=Flavihumibacter petaseus NBRC 106054 TaxID=1220578 RepID=A0A0E9N3S6_9BACT|nr:undecaprenyl-phosphate glucose phosphotransferase [Flavihumibacter petaseus]GAO44336.1 putative UDP-glucose--undecaprenyl-phosphate glucose-1-phosphate transferase [Flavihumibacter petaseus NBRC 106054]